MTSARIARIGLASVLGRRMSREAVALTALATACTIVFMLLSIARHYAFHTSAYDLAMYDQAVWNTSQGRWFEMNLLEDTMPGLTNKLGDHVEPILLPIALLYRLRSNADVLLTVQAIALAVLIWPLYRLVRHFTRGAFLAVLAVFLYLAHPAMWNALLFDFHPVTLAAAFLIFALWMLVQRRRIASLVFALLAMACKEQMGFLVAMLGVYALFFHKIERRFAAALVAVGLIGSIVAFGVVIPTFQPAGESYYLNRYEKLGGSLGEILLAPIAKPDVVWSTLISPKRVAYYGDLLLPLGGLPLLGPEMILPALPDIALNTFSAFAPARTLDAHYAIVIAPFLILAAVWGGDRLAHVFGKRLDRKLVLGIVGAWLAFSIVAFHLDRYGTFLPVSERYIGTYAAEPRDMTGLQIAAEIPAEAVVSAQFTLVPHISQRWRAHIFPRIDDAEYVFLDAQGEIEPFETRAEYAAVVDVLLNDPTFETVSDLDGFLLLRRK